MPHQDFVKRYRIVQDKFQFVASKDATHMHVVPVLVDQVGDKTMYIRHEQVQVWSCTPAPETEISIQLIFPTREIDTKTLAALSSSHAIVSLHPGPSRE